MSQGQAPLKERPPWEPWWRRPKIGMGARRRKFYEIEGTQESKARDNAIMGENDDERAMVRPPSPAES